MSFLGSLLVLSLVSLGQSQVQSPPLTTCFVNGTLISSLAGRPCILKYSLNTTVGASASLGSCTVETQSTGASSQGPRVYCKAPLSNFVQGVCDPSTITTGGTCRTVDGNLVGSCSSQSCGSLPINANSSAVGSCIDFFCRALPVSPSPSPSSSGQACQVNNAGCRLVVAGSTVIGACLNFTCSAQCSSSFINAACYSSESTNVRDGVCQQVAGSTFIQCVRQNATSPPPPSPTPNPYSCSNNSSSSLPCILQDGNLGKCVQTGLAGPVCAPQCPNDVKRQATQAGEACFLSRDGPRNGVCRNGQCVSAIAVSPQPTPFFNRTCTASDVACALDNSGALGQCSILNNNFNRSSSGVCTPQCVVVKRQVQQFEPCFLERGAPRNGVCQRGQCVPQVTTAPTPTPVRIPCNASDVACILNDNTLGQCTILSNGAGNTGGVCTPQCVQVKRQLQQVESCFLARGAPRNGLCQSGRCVQANTSPSPTPANSTCVPSRPCVLRAAGIAITFGECASDGKSCNTQCTGSSSRCFLSTNTNDYDGVCNAGRCERPVAPPTCTEPCRLNDTAGGVAALGMCVENKCVPKPPTPAACSSPSEQFCVLLNGTTAGRGFCNDQRKCQQIECFDKCNDATKVCQGFLCRDRVTTPDLCANVRCANNGTCKVLSLVGTGLNSTQVQQRTDVIYTEGGRAAVCACAAGFVGQSCEKKVDDTNERPSCACANDAAEKDGFCVSRARVCDCQGKNCRCSNGSTNDDCSLKTPPVVNKRTLVLTAIFSPNRTTLLQALAVVQGVLDKKNLKVIVTIESTEQGLKISVESEGPIDEKTVADVAEELGQRSDVIQAVPITADRDAPATQRPSSSTTMAISSIALLIGAVVLL